MKISVAVATYNGEKFIEEQIDSIINQTYTNWILFIRDDHSTDRTVEKIKWYASQYEEKVVLIEDTS